MTRRHAFAICFTTASVAAAPALLGQKPKGDQKMTKFAPHPGTIRMIDESDGSVRIVQADKTPERHRFVYFDKAGIEVDPTEEAVERIPIIEVRMTPTDGKGNLVPKDRAQVVRIKEFGPEKRLLRSTTMSPNKQPVRH
jgi:hypothetical protein